jgi:hypothetical protein
LDAKTVLPIEICLQKRDIAFDEDLAVVIKPMLEDVSTHHPNENDLMSGYCEIEIEISINNQLQETIEQLGAW